MDKKKSIVFKKITVSILSILFVVCAYLPCVPKVNALSNVITYNQYGSFERVNYKSSVASLGISMAGLVGNLQGKYSGSLSININLNGHSLSEYSVIPTNCWITYYDSTVINIQFNDVSQFEVLLTSTTLDATATVTINSLTNWNMNMITYGDNYMQQHIYDSVNQVEGYIDNVESLLTTNNNTLSRCETLLTTISQNGTSGGSSTVNNIDINVDHIADELSLLKLSNDSILDELLGFLADQAGNIISIESVIDAVEDTTTALLGVQNQLTSISTTLNNIVTTLNSINTAVQNIDNSIDTISWIDTQYTEYGYTTDFITRNPLTTNISVPANNYIYYEFNNISNIQNRLLYLRFPLSDSVKNFKYYIVGRSNNGNRLYQEITPDYISRGRTSIDIWINTDKYYFNADYEYFAIYVPQATYSYTNISNTKYTKYMLNTDIEYWLLLQYFEQYNSNKQILDAINSLSIQVTQQDITNTNNNISNYNTTMNTVEGIETNFINNLNTDLSNLNLTTQYVNPVDTNVRTAFDVVVKDIILDNNNFAGPFYLILICSVVLIFLGRF